ncbi:TPA: hypothetical protein ACGU4W_001096 [Vibrio vulnificus]|nr:hypothetical protein [Vibrio vulnificus]
MKLKELQKLYPQLSLDEIKYIRKRFYGVKGRCGNNKYYKEAKCLFNCESFFDWIIMQDEFEQFLAGDGDMQIARIFDGGDYSEFNCQLKSKVDNVTESNLKHVVVYDPITKQSSVFTHGIKALWKMNKHRMGNISYSTLLRKIKCNEPIFMVNIENNNFYSGYVRISNI